MVRRSFMKCSTGIVAGIGSLAFIKAIHADDAKTAPAAAPAPAPAPAADALAESAYNDFIPGNLTCCEAMLKAGCEALGVKNDVIPTIALGLGGGGGMQGKTCGVLTGAAMVISLAYGKKEPDYETRKSKVMKAVAAVYAEFEKKFGATDCEKLIGGIKLATAEGKLAFKEKGIKKGKCTEYVKYASQLLSIELGKV